MAGRGTDIILGGNPTFQTKQKLAELLLSKNIEKEKEVTNNLSENINSIKNKYQSKNKIKELENDIQSIPYSLETCENELRDFYQQLYQEISKKWKEENTLVKELGGLFVLGTERHETRRIDNQLRGRAGRQGDPGISQFFVSLDDELIKIFGGDSIRKWVSYLIQDDETPLESDLLTKSLENAQKKVELYNYDLRKNVFQYDDILNSQRKQLFNARNELVFENIYEELFLRYDEIYLDEELNPKKNRKKDDFEKLFDSYTMYEKLENQKTIQTNPIYEEIWITQDLRFAQSNFYELGFLKNTRSTILLSIVDFYWTEHIERMSYIRETINWRSYGQQNPLIEYNIEAFKSFKLMFEQIRSYMLYYFVNNPINY
jgi:preprotein translocase subunit SecA